MKKLRLQKLTNKPEQHELRIAKCETQKKYIPRTGSTKFERDKKKKSPTLPFFSIDFGSIYIYTTKTSNKKSTNKTCRKFSENPARHKHGVNNYVLLLWTTIAVSLVYTMEKKKKIDLLQTLRFPGQVYVHLYHTYITCRIPGVQCLYRVTAAFSVYCYDSRLLLPSFQIYCRRYVDRHVPQ